MAVGLWAVALEPAQQREPGARRSHSAGGSWGSYEPSLAGVEASKLNSKLDFMLNSKSGLGGSCEELRFVVRALLGRDQFRARPGAARQNVSAPSRRSRASTLSLFEFKQEQSQSVSQSVRQAERRGCAHFYLPSGCGGGKGTANVAAAPWDGHASVGA